jgi:hypothetical protein
LTSCLVFSLTMKGEAIHSSETSGLLWTAWDYILEYLISQIQCGFLSLYLNNHNHVLWEMFYNSQDLYTNVCPKCWTL